MVEFEEDISIRDARAVGLAISDWDSNPSIMVVESPLEVFKVTPFVKYRYYLGYGIRFGINLTVRKPGFA